jgi:hypothetical protein
MNAALTNLTRTAAALALAVITTVPLLAADRNKLLLSVVPVDASTVGAVRFDDMRNHPVAKRLFAETDKLTVDGEAMRFLTQAGLKPTEDIDGMIFAASQREGSEQPDFLVAVEGRFAPARLTEVVLARGAVARSATGKNYLFFKEQGSDDTAAVAFVDQHLALAGTESAVIKALTALSNGGSRFAAASGLGYELGRIDQNASSWILIDVPRSQRFVGAPKSPTTGGMSDDAFASALKRVAVFSAQANADAETLTFKASAVSSDAETRELLADMMRGLTATWRMAAQEKKPELVNVIRKFDVADEKGAVTLTGSIPVAMLEEFSRRTPQQKASR